VNTNDLSGLKNLAKIKQHTKMYVTYTIGRRTSKCLWDAGMT
jgi:hypothetical protein